MSKFAESSRRWRERHPDRQQARQAKQLAKPDRPSNSRRQHLRRSYGLTVEQYDAMVKEHDGKCAVCGNKETYGSLPVDHDHSTKKIRGLLCHRCNRGIGMFKDSPELCERAASYLRRH